MQNNSSPRWADRHPFLALMGVQLDCDGIPRTVFKAKLELIDRKQFTPPRRAIGGAVGWAIEQPRGSAGLQASTDKKSLGPSLPDRSLLDRSCKLLSQIRTEPSECNVGESLGKALQEIFADAPALQNAPANVFRGSFSMHHLFRLELIREFGRALAREKPEFILKKDGLEVVSWVHGCSDDDESALVHGVTLELAHQGVLLPYASTPTNRFKALRPGLEQEEYFGGLSTLKARELTERVVSSPEPLSNLKMHLNLKALLVSSLHHHAMGTENQINRLALKHFTSDSSKNEGSRLPAPFPSDPEFANALHTMITHLDVDSQEKFREEINLIPRQDAQAFAKSIGSALGKYHYLMSPRILQCAADAYLRREVQNSVATKFSLESEAPPAQDEIVGLDVDPSPAQDSGGRSDSKAIQTASIIDQLPSNPPIADFYEIYVGSCVMPAIKQFQSAWADRHNHESRSHVELAKRVLQTHERIIRDELANYLQRPYVQAALNAAGADRERVISAIQARLHGALTTITETLASPLPRPARSEGSLINNS